MTRRRARGIATLLLAVVAVGVLLFRREDRDDAPNEDAEAVHRERVEDDVPQLEGRPGAMPTGAAHAAVAPPAEDIESPAKESAATLTLEGVVVDERDVPVANLPVLVATMSGPPRQVWGSTVTEPAGHARTDAEGRFRIEGLDAGRYGVVSEEHHVFLRQEHLFEPGIDVARVVAVSSRAVLGVVRDAVTGEPLSKGHVVITLRKGNDTRKMTMTSLDEGHYLTVFPVTAYVRGNLTARVKVQATGYRPAEASTDIGPDSPVATIDLRLTPNLEEKGTVLLTVTNARGAALPGTVSVSAVRRADQQSFYLHDVKPVRAGVFRFELREGHYDLEVHPSHLLGSYAASTCEVEVLGGTEVTARVAMPEGATLRLRMPLLPEDATWPASLLSLESVGAHAHQVAGGSTDLTLVEPEIRAGRDLVWSAVLPGTWRITLQWAGETIEREVTLRAGDDQLVDFR